MTEHDSSPRVGTSAAVFIKLSRILGSSENPHAGHPRNPNGAATPRHHNSLEFTNAPRFLPIADA